MLRFLLLLMLIIVLFKVGQENPRVGFGLYLFLVCSFVIYSNNIVESKDLQFERELLKTREGRKIYYEIINSQ